MFVIVPLFLGYGYLVRVIRQVAAGDTETPPAFEDWGELFVDGLVSVVITVAYSLVPVIAFAVLFAGVFPALGADGGGAVTGVVVALGLLSGLVAFLVALAAMYLLPAAWAAYAVTGTFGPAFSPSTLWTVGTDKRYLMGVLLALVINFVAQFAANMVALTIVGILLIPFVVFYGQVASAYAVGAGVADTGLVTQQRDPESDIGHSLY